MVDYDDITQTLLIDQIRIQYDSSSEWHKYLKSSLRNPHSFVYPDKHHYSDLYRSREIDFINSSCLSKGYKIKHIDKLTRDENDEDGAERYLFEIEKTPEKNFSEDEEALMRKIVYFFKESMQYYMSFSESDDLYGEKAKNIRKKDIKYNTDYELFKGLNDCIVSLHDSKDNRFQAFIMTNDFCGLFSPNYIRLTKYTDAFKGFLKESHIQYFDLFDEEIKNNEFYKKKKQYFDYLKSSAYVPLTRGEISLANKKKAAKDVVVKSEYQKETGVSKVSLQNQQKLFENNDTSSKKEITENEKEKEEKEEEEKKKKLKKKKKESVNKIETNDENKDEQHEESLKEGDQEELTREKKRKRKEEKEEKKKKKKKKKEKEKKRKRAEEKEEVEEKGEKTALNKDSSEEQGELSLCLEDAEPTKETKEDKVEEKLHITTASGESEELLNYLNIKQEKDGVSKQDLMPSDIKIFNLLNKKVNSDEYIYKELKGDFMKEINLPNNYSYEVHMIQIHEKCVKNFYRCVIKHINKKREKIRVYHIISNFLFFYAKMYKTYINFDDSVHKDINKNFDYKSITIQGCILPYNFFLFLKGLNLMSAFNLINTFYINVNYDERKNKCLHFLNITENKFYENFKRFEHNIKSKFLYVHKFLQNVVPVHKYLISKGKLHRNLESLPFTFETNDVLQLTYNQQNDGNNNEIVIYDESSNMNNGTDGGIMGTGAATFAGGTVGGRGTGKNAFLGNRSYAIYISKNVQGKGVLNLKSHYKFLSDKDVVTVIKDVLDMNDNLIKNLLSEKKILFLLDLYEKNMMYQHFLFNTAFFGTYISLHRIFYINTFMKSSPKVKDLPLFRPSCFGELVEHIIKRKKEKETKATTKKVANLHTVDKLCNTFFKESFNKILNTKIKEGYRENLMENLQNEDDIKKAIHSLGEQGEQTAQTAETVQTAGDNVVEEKENVEKKNLEEDTKLVAIAPVGTVAVETPEKREVIDGTKGGEPIVESTLVVNEIVVRKKEFDKTVINIFVFINENALKFTEEEKEIRELILNVLKSKENIIENGVKYIHKYRNNINDAITLTELEMRKNDESCKINIIGLILCSDIANHTLQRNIKHLYDLKKLLETKYSTNKIEITTKVFTYYWIFDVYTYGTLFLKDKEKPHLLKETTDGAYELPYVMQWKDKPLWGYHLFIIKDYIHSKYTDEMLEQLNEEGVRVTLCQECFEVQIFEDDLKQVLELHNLDFTSLKYADQNIYLNTLFLVENGHLIYLALMDTDHVKMKHEYNCLNIQIYNSQVCFPSFHTGTPILNDSWLMEVLEKRQLVPYDQHYYKY